LEIDHIPLAPGCFGCCKVEEPANRPPTENGDGVTATASRAVGGEKGQASSKGPEKRDRGKEEMESRGGGLELGLSCGCVELVGVWQLSEAAVGGAGLRALGKIGARLGRVWEGMDFGRQTR